MDQWYVRRFLRATKQDYAKCKARLDAHLTWRVEYGIAGKDGEKASDRWLEGAWAGLWRR